MPPRRARTVPGRELHRTPSRAPLWIWAQKRRGLEPDSRPDPAKMPIQNNRGYVRNERSEVLRRALPADDTCPPTPRYPDEISNAFAAQQSLTNLCEIDSTADDNN